MLSKTPPLRGNQANCSTTFARRLQRIDTWLLDWTLDRRLKRQPSEPPRRQPGMINSKLIEISATRNSNLPFLEPPRKNVEHSMFDLFRVNWMSVTFDGSAPAFGSLCGLLPRMRQSQLGFWLGVPSHVTNYRPIRSLRFWEGSSFVESLKVMVVTHCSGRAHVL